MNKPSMNGPSMQGGADARFDAAVRARHATALLIATPFRAWIVNTPT